MDASPYAAVVWSRNGVSIGSEDDNCTYKKHTLESNVHSIVLKSEKLGENISCEATNFLGYDVKYIDLPILPKIDSILAEVKGNVSILSVKVTSHTPVMSGYLSVKRKADSAWSLIKVRDGFSSNKVRVLSWMSDGSDHKMAFFPQVS